MSLKQPTIYYNCACSKSNQTLDLLKQKGYEPTIINYLETPPSIDELKLILKKLNLTVIDIFRQTEPSFVATGLEAKKLSDDELLKLMIESPHLIQRPIVVFNDKAALGRPAENILTILT